VSTNFLGGGVVLDEAGRPLDQIVLTGITATGYHGVYEHERREGQTFVADVVVHLDTRRAAASDDLTRTVNYGVLAEAVAGVLSGEPADLVETVAERIAATALAEAGVAAVDVAVHKPQAPITVPFDDVVVRVHRDHHKLPAAEPWRRPAGTHEAPRAAEGRTAQAAVGAAGAASSGPVAHAAPAAGAATVHGGHASPDGSGPQPVPGGSASQPTPAVEQPDRLDQPPAAPVEAVLALGGNLGSAQTTLREAVADIEGIAGVDIVAVSPLARTAPVGGPGQPDFLNAVVIVRTTLAPRALLHAAQAIEQRHGRERLEHWGPRTLDIDLITYGSTLAVADDLELPHPRAHQRAFVLQPWAQVAPDAVLPGLGGGPVAALAATAPDRDGVRWLALDWMTAAVPSGPREHHADDEPVRLGAEHPADAPADSPAATIDPTADDLFRDDHADGHRADDPRDGIDDTAGPYAAGPHTAGPDIAGPDTAGPHDARTDDAAGDGDGPGTDPSPARASDGPLDWLPSLPATGGTGAPGVPGSPPGARSPIFSPVVAPDDVPHPGDRQL
jgi:dihydroneopterin aldolase/2-amino-4-hydroxy-6-hydroxymethyldihydropteridine diphosphokinase